MRSLTRRRFLETIGATAIATGLAGRAQSRTRLILLGTAGGPRPKIDRAASSQAIVVGDRIYIVDCGDGVARRMTEAGLDLTRLVRVFITHHHSDHNADYGTLLLLAWASGLQTRVGTHGPPPLAAMTEAFFAQNAFDIATRMADEMRVPLRPLIVPHETSAGGLIVEENGVRVTAALVNHPPVVPAFAYRFDTPDRSIVISGDTTRSDALQTLARDADVLVHEALFRPGIERTAARVANAERLLEHILASHTTVEDVARLATAARVRTLVLSHLVPADDPAVTDADWIAAASPHFDGEIIVGRDLLEI